MLEVVLVFTHICCSVLGIALGYKLAESSASRAALKIQKHMQSELAPLRAAADAKVAAIREARKKLDAMNWNEQLKHLGDKESK